MHIFNAGGSARWGPVPFMKKPPGKAAVMRNFLVEQESWHYISSDVGFECSSLWEVKDNGCSVEPNFAWSLKSELKVQVLLFTHPGTFAAMRCPIVTDRDLKISRTKYRAPMSYEVLIAVVALSVLESAETVILFVPSDLGIMPR